LEDGFTVIVGNASLMRNVPGRKTVVKDAEWIADLVRHGLVRASFVPPPQIRVLRELIRHRKAVGGNLAAERNRTLQLLGGANIKLAGVMSDVFGVSGMLMLRALAEGGAAPVEMADLAKRRLRHKVDRLALALDGHLAEHQRLLLSLQIRRLAEIDRDLAEVGAAISIAMQPFAAQQACLTTIPGVDALTAAAIIAEIGIDMSVFGTAQRLAAWAGVCPANHESAGKQKRRGTRKGNTFLKAALVTAAISASQAKGIYLRDKFHRLKTRMGSKKAAMAIAHKILVAIFHMLERGTAFADLGGDYLDRVKAPYGEAPRSTPCPARIRRHASAQACRVASMSKRHSSVRGPPSEFSGQPIPDGAGQRYPSASLLHRGTVPDGRLNDSSHGLVMIGRNLCNGTPRIRPPGLNPIPAHTGSENPQQSPSE
jgi:transposase